MPFRVLIVDDSKTILKVNSAIVKNALPICEIMTFDRPQIALDTLLHHKQSIHMALLDYNMEGMNGAELAKALVEITPSIIDYKRICVISANVQDAVVKKIRSMGVEFVPKPFDESKFKEFIQKIGLKIGQ